MKKDPPPFVWAVPEEENILNCEYALLSSAYTGDHVAEMDCVLAGHFILVRQSNHQFLSPQMGISHVFSISLRSGDLQIPHTRAANTMG
jgi:hypothetical protein